MTSDSFAPICFLRRRRQAASALAAFLLCAPAARAQDVTAPSLKAAFVYNVAKFTEWPQDTLPATSSLTACVLGDGDVGDALTRAVKDRLLAGRGITVSRVQQGDALRACHLLYISNVTAAQVAAVLVEVQGAPVLTISDVENFVRLGGIVHVFIEDGRMRFDVRADFARQARLQLSSRLLALAVRYNDGPSAALR
jgi:YfiR/HmsC-like